MRLSVLPAGDGDCLILSYGTPVRHVVIDGGRIGTHQLLRKRLAEVASRGEQVELLVVTHFDADHIEGILRLAEANPPQKPNRVWFNGFDQLSALQPMNERQADALSVQFGKLGWSLNSDLPGGAACLGKGGDLVQVVLPGDLELVLLSPDRARLETLRRQWERFRSLQADHDDDEEQSKGPLQPMGRKRRSVPTSVDVRSLADTPEVLDDNVPNGSSIAFLARHAGRSVLFAADAHPDLLLQGVERLADIEGGRLTVDVFKVSHHGSMKNTTKALIERLDCSRFVISTNGKVHDHPHPEAVARILTTAPDCDRQLYFNYRQKWTELWDESTLKSLHRYNCIFPDTDDGIEIEV